MARSRAVPEDASAILSFLKHHAALLAGVPEAALRRLASQAFVRRCHAGDHVCRSGDPAAELSFVREGRLFVNQRSPDGNLQSIGIMVRGDVAGLMAVSSPIFLWDVVASVDSVLVVIPRAPMLELIEKNAAVARAVLHGYGRRLRYVETLLYFAREKVDKRLAVTLIYLHERFGATLPLTRMEIGQLSGTTPETAMRMLKRFETMKLLKGYRGRIEIKDLEGLKRWLGLDSSRL